MRRFLEAPARGLSIIKLLCILALVALVVAAVWVIRPELFRIRGVQTPVSVTVHDTLFGLSEVLRIENVSEKPLEKVVVTAIKPETNEHARYEIESLDPGESEDVSRSDLGWKLEPGHRIEVDAKGYAPIVFTSKQLGIE